LAVTARQHEQLDRLWHTLRRMGTELDRVTLVDE